MSEPAADKLIGGDSASRLDLDRVEVGDPMPLRADGGPLLGTATATMISESLIQMRYDLNGQASGTFTIKLPYIETYSPPPLAMAAQTTYTLSTDGEWRVGPVGLEPTPKAL